MGSAVFRTKFIKESKYVNGVEVVGAYTTHLDDESDNSEIFYTDNYDELLEKVDAVYIISKPEKHFRHTKKALEAGKHVLCESPIAYAKNYIL